MQLNSYETSQIDPAELAAASARCTLALGRLDGALTYAPPKIAALFALILVRRTLVRSLAAAGHLFTDAAFTAWLSRAAGPPPGGPGTAAPAPVIAAAAFAEMRASRWAVLAEAADLAWRAAPHLGRLDDCTKPEEAREAGQRGAGHGEAGEGIPQLSQHEAATLSIEAARSLLLETKGLSAQMNAAPLCVLADRLGAVPALFAPIERASAVIETDAGRIAVPLMTQHAQGWALGLVVGAMMVEQGVLRRPLPFAGTIAPEVLRRDCEADTRLLRLSSDIAQAARDMLGDLETARRLIDRADTALVDARSTSRAPAVFALIAGLGVATRLQIIDAFSMTAAGVDGVLAKLLAAGLVERRTGRTRGFYLAAGAGAAPNTNTGSMTHGHEESGVGDFEAAIAEVDRLLARPAG